MIKRMCDESLIMNLCSESYKYMWKSTCSHYCETKPSIRKVIRFVLYKKQTKVKK